MKIIGLTGGIGSGKSTLLKWIELKEIPCFQSDQVGKNLLENELKHKVVDCFGLHLYESGKLDRGELAQIVFSNTTALKKLNDIVHPAVAIEFKKFKDENKTKPMVVKESAILFESGIYKSCDFIILVCASMEERVLRVMKRDGMSRAAVLERMSNQWDDSKKRILADFVIENNDLEFAEQQLEYLFEKVLYETKD